MNRPAYTVAATPASARPSAPILIGVGVYIVLAAIAAATGNNLLSIGCGVLLVSLVLGPKMLERKLVAWVLWIAFAAALGWLGLRGQGVVVIDLMPVLINFALAWLFGSTLGLGKTPLVARAIIAIEGHERLALRGVERYARRLTLAWSALFVVQACVQAAIVAARHGVIAPPPSSLALAYLHFGGYCVPALFMLGEFVFRRHHLRHVPHDSLGGFMHRLVRNWPRLLRDSAAALDTTPPG